MRLFQPMGDDIHFFLLPQQPPCLRFGSPIAPGGLGSIVVAPAAPPPALFLSMLFIWKTTLNAVWNTLLRPFFSFAEQTTNPWKAYFFAAYSISWFDTQSASLAVSPVFSSSSRKSSLVPTRMQGHARAVVLTSLIHFLQAFSSEFRYIKLKQMIKQSVLA